MSLSTTGLTGGGLTTHYQIQYDDTLSHADGIDRANGLVGACEGDYDLMSGWFGGISLTVGTPVTVNIVPGPYASAGWGPPITLKPGNGSDLTLVRYLLVAEVTEMFMLAQDRGWFAPDGSNEGSAGEGLSRFLSSRFLVAKGLGETEPGFDLANSWLGSVRSDFVNHIDPGDHGIDAKTGCSILFIYYLFKQLGFTETQIVGAAASELAGVYANLTGDSGDPFPFFKRLLDNAFPGTSTITTGNLDDPFPLGMMSFWVDKSSFGRDEVQDVIASSGGRFPDAFWLVLEGFSIDSFLALGIDIPNPAGPFTSLPGVSVVRSATPVEFEDPTQTKAPQRIRLAYDVVFHSSSLASFPAPGAGPALYELDAHATAGGSHLAGSDSSTVFELVGGADPYFTNIDPAQDNVFWLSQDLRVFTATPALHPVPVPGGPTFSTDSVSGAFSYVQSLVQHLNDHFSNPSGIDPFSVLVPGQGGALTGDSSVTPATVDWSRFPPAIRANYNFALARVRLRGTSAANNVKVFFRLWSTETADTDFQPDSTYNSTSDAAGLPAAPLVGTDHHTLPFFATGNLGSNTDYAPGGVNNRAVSFPAGQDSVWAYFGAFLNIYDSTNLVDGQPVQHWLNGTHHCLVAQIAYDDAPIQGAAGVVPNPENCDKLAQRNLQVTHSDNPGGPESHRVPQTFDIRPGPALQSIPGSLLDQPDELMIDWGRVPRGSVAHIYWPQVDSAAVVEMADALYGTHALRASDAHTVDIDVTRGVSYVPILPGTGPNYAGLFTLDLPTTVVVGQEFDVVVRRVTTRRGATRVPTEVPKLGLDARFERNRLARGTESHEIVKTDPPNRKAVRNWRHVVGTFQVKIPVSTPELMLRPEEDALAILKWRLQSKAPSDRWVPVLRRLVEQVAARVDGLGGDSNAIPPSLLGAPLPQDDGEGGGSGNGGSTVSGTVVEVLFDCAGRFEGFVLRDCCREHRIPTREKGIEEIVLRALRERWELVLEKDARCKGIGKISLRG
jgi:hypothetical protein